MDVLHDNSFRKWVKIATLLGIEQVPHYVRQYTLPDEKTASTLSDGLFADPVNRLYPVGDKASTWLSAAYYAFDAFSPGVKIAEDVWQAINNAAAIYSITDDIVKVRKDLVAAFATKEASAEDSNYGWLERDGSGNVTGRRYPMFDSDGVRKAASYFDENRKHYGISMCRTVAGNILRKAAEYGLDTNDLPASIEREAGMGLPRRTVIMRELNERAELSKDAENGALLANISRLVGASDDTELHSNLEKIAEVLEQFDKLEGLTTHYGKGITYPTDFLFGISIKEADAFVAQSVKLHRYIFNVEKLANNLPVQMISDILGEKRSADACEEGKLSVVKFAAMLNHLPMADKAALEDGILAVYGE